MTDGSTFANGDDGEALFLVLLFLQASEPAQPRVLHLDDAVDRALKAQPTVRTAHAQYVAADARVDEARAPMLPQITLTASYQRIRTAAFGGGRGATVTGTGTATGDTTGTGTGTGGATTPGAIATSTDSAGINVFTFGGNASQLLWDFGAAYNRTRTASRYASSAQASERTARQNVTLDVRRSYFAARANRAFVQVAKDSLQNLGQHLTQIEGFVKVGTRPEIDLAQARTDVANGKVALIDAENAYAVSKAQLARAIGDGSADFEIADDELPPIDGEDAPVDTLVSRAMSQRPELVALEREKEGRELAVKSVKGNYGPRLTANAGASETGTALDDLGPAWNVGVALSWPIFQGGLTRAQVREAEADLDVTSASLDAQKLQVQVDVKQAALSLKAAKASLEANADVVKNAEERLRLAEGRYTSGVGSAIELGDAQVAVTNARAQLVQARYRVSSARADLLAALGQKQ